MTKQTIKSICGTNIEGLNICVSYNTTKNYNPPIYIKNLEEFVWREVLEKLSHETNKILKKENVISDKDKLGSIFSQIDNDTKATYEFDIRKYIRTNRNGKDIFDIADTGTAIAKIEIKRFKNGMERYLIKSICIFIEKDYNEQNL